MTALKQQLTDVIRTGKGHMTAEEVFLDAKAKGIRVSVASVYRVLGELAAEGRLLRICVPGEPDRFDHTVIPHEHAVCTGCGRVTDFELPGFTRQLEQALGTGIESYELSVRYLCEACGAKKTE